MYVRLIHFFSVWPLCLELPLLKTVLNSFQIFMHMVLIRLSLSVLNDRYNLKPCIDQGNQGTPMVICLWIITDPRLEFCWGKKTQPVTTKATRWKRSLFLISLCSRITSRSWWSTHPPTFYVIILDVEKRRIRWSRLKQ